jgi:hypothetical protein
MIADKNVMEMLRTVAGLEKGAALDEVDLSAAAETWLTAHGMSPEAINTIKGKLQEDSLKQERKTRVLRICLRLWPEADRNVPGVLPFYENHEVANSISFHN